jgi:hypothetical protein
MAARRPAGPVRQKTCVIDLPDENVSRPARARPGSLRMAFQAEIRVTLNKQLGVDRSMGIMANSATFTQRLVLEHKRPRLLAMALRASLIQPRHRQSARRLHDVHPMRIMALDTIHFALEDRMMLRQMKLRVGFQVALEACLRFLAGIDNKFSPAATGSDMFAGRSVARFTALQARHVHLVGVQARVRTRRKRAADVRVTIQANLVANVSGPFNFWRNHEGAVRGARIHQQQKRASAKYEGASSQPTPLLHVRFPGCRFVLKIAI